MPLILEVMSPALRKQPDVSALAPLSLRPRRQPRGVPCRPGAGARRGGHPAPGPLPGRLRGAARAAGRPRQGLRRALRSGHGGRRRADARVEPGGERCRPPPRTPRSWAAWWACSNISWRTSLVHWPRGSRMWSQLMQAPGSDTMHACGNTSYHTPGCGCSAHACCWKYAGPAAR